MLGMKKIITVLLILCFPVSASAWMAKVVSVVDGDTLKVFNVEKGQETIRLYGIDTPEQDQPHGNAAGKCLASFIAGAIVDVEQIYKDTHGRTVGIVWNEEKNINMEMIRSGYAWVYREFCDKPFCEYWLVLEDEAKADKRGLWQAPHAVPPWQWRKTNCD
jgi:endonuclease YncB( thermonuclease family)